MEGAGGEDILDVIGTVVVVVVLQEQVADALAGIGHLK